MSAYFVLNRHCSPRLAFAICGQGKNRIANMDGWMDVSEISV